MRKPVFGQGGDSALLVEEGEVYDMWFGCRVLRRRPISFCIGPVEMGRAKAVTLPLLGCTFPI